MYMVKLRSKNRITLPGKVVALAGLKEGDFLNFTGEGTRIVITAPEIRERGAGYTMSDLLIHLRADFGLRSMDALHLATALVHDCGTFITNDQRFARVDRPRVLTLHDLNDPGIVALLTGDGAGYAEGRGSTGLNKARPRPGGCPCPKSAHSKRKRICRGF